MGAIDEKQWQDVNISCDPAFDGQEGTISTRAERRSTGHCVTLLRIASVAIRDSLPSSRKDRLFWLAQSAEGRARSCLEASSRLQQAPLAFLCAHRARTTSMNDDYNA